MNRGLKYILIGLIAINSLLLLLGGSAMLYQYYVSAFLTYEIYAEYLLLIFGLHVLIVSSIFGFLTSNLSSLDIKPMIRRIGVFIFILFTLYILMIIVSMTCDIRFSKSFLLIFRIKTYLLTMLIPIYLYVLAYKKIQPRLLYAASAIASVCLIMLYWLYIFPQIIPSNGNNIQRFVFEYSMNIFFVIPLLLFPLYLTVLIALFIFKSINNWRCPGIIHICFWYLCIGSFTLVSFFIIGMMYFWS